MDFYKEEWLRHLKGSIPNEARRNRTSLYTIALEGWRRGLKLKFYRKTFKESLDQLYYSLESDSRIHYFNESSGDKNTEEAFAICRDKGITSQYLEKANVPIPKGKSFDHTSEITEMLKYAESLTFPLVVKPTDGSSGKGVVTNISDLNALKDAIHEVREKLGFENIIIQEHIKGKEVRIYVLNDQVIAAANRLPANVVGDGKSTIIKLIEEKNKYRKHIPHLYYRPIVINNDLRKILNEKGYTLDSVLKEGERLFLREVSNVSTGGEPIDVTEQLTENQKKIAVKAVKAIPGLVHCGVDMMIRENSDSGVILELNTRPGIGSHLFPIEGNARDIPKAIIDYYFPETIGINVESSNVYFGLQTIFDSLYGGYLSEVEVKNHPESNLKSKRMIISTSLELLDFYKRIEKLILQLDISGFIRKNSNEKIELIIGNENIQNLERLESFIVTRKSYFKMNDIVEQTWNLPIRIGFELLDGINQMSLIELEHTRNQNHKDIRTLEKEVNRINKRIALMEKSQSWKLTKPIRKMKKLIKR